jgi:hypothetical protein
VEGTVPNIRRGISHKVPRYVEGFFEKSLEACTAKKILLILELADIYLFLACKIYSQAPEALNGHFLPLIF